MLANSALINHQWFSTLKTLYPATSVDLTRRRYDLDWLRVLVFALLILYHTGMFYVENWGWHVKSSYQSQLLESIMLLVEPWRMPIIWFISGVAMRFTLAKVALPRFILLRSHRLLLPLLFGILVVVPPQLYVEMSAKGEIALSYWQFLQAFFSDNHPVFAQYQAGIWPHIDVNHLWYLRSLWRYSLILVCLIPLLHLNKVQQFSTWFSQRPLSLIISLLILPVLTIQLAVEHDLTRYPLGFTFMLYGYLFGWQTHLAQQLAEHIKAIVMTFMVCLTLFISFYNVVWLNVNPEVQANDLIMLGGMLAYSVMRVIGVMMVLAIGFKYLNRPSSQLSNYNQAVYPVYILHQTLIITVGYALSSLGLGPIIEPVLLILLTIISCFLLLKIILHIDILRPCFGIKTVAKYSKNVINIGYGISLVLLIPLAWRLLA